MSSLEEPRQEPDKDKYLTQPEREQLQRLLSQPEEFPRELGSWITDYVGTNAFLQKSQVQGLPLLNSQVQTALDTLETLVTQVAASQITATTASVTTSQSTTSGSYTDLATAGPTVSGLDDGIYVVQFGAACWNTAGGSDGAECSMSVNGAAASSTDMISCYGITNPISLSRSIFKTVSAGAGSNSFTMKYKIANGGTAVFEGRWIVALKIGS